MKPWKVAIWIKNTHTKYRYYIPESSKGVKIEHLNHQKQTQGLKFYTLGGSRYMSCQPISNLTVHLLSPLNYSSTNSKPLETKNPPRSFSESLPPGNCRVGSAPTLGKRKMEAIATPGIWQRQRLNFGIDMSFRGLALLWFFFGGDGRERKEWKSIHAHNKKLNVYACSIGNWKSFHIPFIFNRTCIFQRSKVRAPDTVQPTIFLYRQGLVSWPMVQGPLTAFRDKTLHLAAMHQNLWEVFCRFLPNHACQKVACKLHN